MLSHLTVIAGTLGPGQADERLQTATLIKASYNLAENRS